MKKSLVLSVLLSVAYSFNVFAQSPQQAQSSYQAFVQAFNGGNKVDTYNKLYEAYQNNLALLKSATSGSADYQQAKRNLMSMWPHLENAAIYYSGNRYQANAVIMAEAHIDMTKMDEFRGSDFNYSSNYSKIVYFVASNHFNSRNYKKAIPYLSEYLRLGESNKRRDVFVCLAKAYQNENDVRNMIQVLRDAASAYPTDYDVLSNGINACMDMKNYSDVQPFLDKMKAIRPNDVKMLNIQAKVYEETRCYEQALDTYKQIQRSSPNSLEVAKHIALNTYNLGVLNNNKAMTEDNAANKKRLMKQSEAYFSDAQPVLEQIVKAEPSSVKYNSALAVVYSCLKKNDKLNDANRTLASMGAGTVGADYIPQLMSFSNESRLQDYQPAVQPTIVSNADEAPLFSVFAKDIIEKKVTQWQAKDPYETVDEYKSRVTETARNEYVKRLQKEAEAEYIKTYGGGLTIDAFTLKPYDAENGVFLIDSKLGQLVVAVPRTNNEAKLFEKNWNGVSLSNQQYCIANDNLALASVTFNTPMGKSYTYNNQKALSYTETNVDVHFDAIDYSMLASASTGNKPSVNISKQDVNVGVSDVDMNIPQGSNGNDKIFVLIIANEDYKAVAKVPYTTNDGKTFAEYCKKTLALPASNIHLAENATFIEMRRQIKWFTDVLKTYNGEARGILYYAGHGIPDETTRSAYLLPVDGDGTDVSTGLSLAKLYEDLGAVPSEGVTVLLDACFSGASREGEMLASARGVAIKAKKAEPVGNVVVLSAATGDETAWPYKEKGHGMFTYFLLKKLQDTQGKATLGDIADYVTKEVSRKSIAVNSKSQTPTISAPVQIGNDWRKWKLK